MDQARTTTVVLTVLLAAVVLPARSTAAEDNDVILGVAKTFWVALNLGDYADLPALVRAEDVGILPQPNALGAEMMKMKDLPQLAPVRREVQTSCLQAYTLSTPTALSDGTNAAIRVSLNVEKARPFFELKMIYDVYMGQAYYDKRDGKDFPSLEAVRARVLAPESPSQKRITKILEEAKKIDFPDIQLEKTTEGWRVNFKPFLRAK